MDKTDVGYVRVLGYNMEREERLRRMNELLDKEDFNYDDYKELKVLIKDMEDEYHKMKERYTRAVYGLKES